MSDIEDDVNANEREDGECILSKVEGRSGVWESFVKVIYKNEMDTVLTIILKKNIPTQVANEMVEKFVKMCSLDLCSFEFVDGNGFKELGQYLVNLGANYGHLDIDSLLPHPTTISRNTIKTVKELRDKLMLKLMPYFYENRCSATTDMWTDDYKKLSYISITIHYINENWELNLNVLHWLDNEKSGDNFLSKITWVTVRAVDFSPIEKLISASKSLVRYKKKNGDNNLLSRPLVQHVETRWNSNLAMLRAVHDMYDELIKIYEASNQFEGTIRPTIQLVLLHWAKLLKHLNSIVSEEKYDDIFKHLAHRTLIIFKEKFKTNIYHGIALFLCPPFKKLRMVENIDERQDILQWWKEHSDKLPLMAKLASRILAIPASSAASERSFSTSGKVIEERRTRLKGDTVDSLLFLNDFFKKKIRKLNIGRSQNDAKRMRVVRRERQSNNDDRG
ncbi:zinc finger protein 618-like [Aphis craccivora]|uniref:Zinc finger protein 618-like n=1 Tax=Aphis craccivora TaxID=307492 RepID=A0A6G0WVR8_APHCR|nr:zinc finger protein 618-like [Aphis craccivora]